MTVGGGDDGGGRGGQRGAGGAAGGGEGSGARGARQAADGGGQRGKRGVTGKERGMTERKPLSSASGAPAVEAGGHRGPEKFPEAWGVEAAQPFSRIGGAAQSAHQQPIAGMAHPSEEIAVDDGRSLETSEAALPEPVVVGPREQRARGEAARKQRIADPESPQRVLEAGRLPREQNAAAAGAARQAKLSRAAEAMRTPHRQSDAPLEEFERPVEIALLVFELVEEARRDRAVPAVDQQIGITLRSQTIGENAEDSVGHVRVENVSDGNGVGTSWPVGSYRGPKGGRLSLPETKLDAALDRRGLHSRVERAGVRPSPHEVEQGIGGSQDRLAFRRPVEDAFPAGYQIEAGLDAQLGQLFQDVSRRRPVLDSLEIAVEPHAHVVPELVDDNRNAGVRQRHGGGQSGRTRA